MTSDSFRLRSGMRFIAVAGHRFFRGRFLLSMDRAPCFVRRPAAGLALARLACAVWPGSPERENHCRPFALATLDRYRPATPFPHRRGQVSGCSPRFRAPALFRRLASSGICWRGGPGRTGSLCPSATPGTPRPAPPQADDPAPSGSAPRRTWRRTRAPACPTARGPIMRPARASAPCGTGWRPGAAAPRRGSARRRASTPCRAAGPRGAARPARPATSGAATRCRGRQGRQPPARAAPIARC